MNVFGVFLVIGRTSISQQLSRKWYVGYFCYIAQGRPTQGCTRTLNLLTLRSTLHIVIIIAHRIDRLSDLQSSENKKQKSTVVHPDESITTMAALSAVVHHHEAEELRKLRTENEKLQKKLCFLTAIQMETAVDHDIFEWFDKINDPEDTETTIEKLLELRDFILQHSVTAGRSSAGPCRFSTIGGHYDLCGSVIMAAQRYEDAVQKHGADQVQPEHWQWPRDHTPAHLCHQQCFVMEHMHVEPTYLAESRYTSCGSGHIQPLPTHFIQLAMQKEQQQAGPRSSGTN